MLSVYCYHCCRRGCDALNSNQQAHNQRVLWDGRQCPRRMSVARTCSGVVAGALCNAMQLCCQKRKIKRKIRTKCTRFGSRMAVCVPHDLVVVGGSPAHQSSDADHRSSDRSASLVFRKRAAVRVMWWKLVLVESSRFEISASQKFQGC